MIEKQRGGNKQEHSDQCLNVRIDGTIRLTHERESSDDANHAKNEKRNGDTETHRAGFKILDTANKYASLIEAVVAIAIFAVTFGQWRLARTIEQAFLAVSDISLDESHGLIGFSLQNSGRLTAEAASLTVYEAILSEPEELKPIKPAAHQYFTTTLPDFVPGTTSKLPFTIPIAEWSTDADTTVRQGRATIAFVGRVDYYNGLGFRSWPCGELTICIKSYVHFATKQLTFRPCNFEETLHRLRVLETKPDPKD